MAATTNRIFTFDQKKNSVDLPGGEASHSPPPRKLSRSQSITTSTIPSSILLPPEMETQWRRRRESLEKLQLDKVAPWMHLHDFSEVEAAKLAEMQSQWKRRRESLEKLQLDKVAPWMHLHDFNDADGEATSDSQ